MQYAELKFKESEFPLKCLVDTGSQINLIRSRSIPMGTPLVKMERKFTMGTTTYTSKHMVELTQLGITDIFHVMDPTFRMPFSVLIGTNFLNNRKFKLTTDNLELRGKIFPIYLNGLAIPPNTKMLCKIKVKQKEGDCIVNFTQEIDIDSPAVICNITNYEIEFPIENLGKQQQILFTEDIEVNSIHTFDIKSKSKRQEKLLNGLRLNHIEPHKREKLWKLLKPFDKLFRLEGDKLPKAPNVLHKITLSEDKIVNVKSYAPPEAHTAEVNKQIDKMLDEDIIRESESPYNSPIWVVPKKMDASGEKKYRVVIDFRKMNELTPHDAYPVPKIEEILDRLGKAKFFAALDLSSGFHQIALEEDSKKYTAFSTKKGHFEFQRMPFGLKNSPATFQRMMDQALAGLNQDICFVYMDDIIIWGQDFEDFLKNIQTVFQRLESCGLTLQPDKCEFMKEEFVYLGHTISKNGLQPNDEKIKSVKEFPIPKNPKEIKSFLGLAGYYRRFIKNFSTIAKPLTELTKKDRSFDFNTKCKRAFQNIKEKLISAPVLKFPDFEKKFTLTTDASNTGLGAILSQEGHPICYMSRTLKKAEENYTTTEKELLAIVWAVKRLRYYLLGRKFEVQTDHKALVWLYGVTDPASRLLRWRLKLEEYDMEIVYKKGCENKAADALSRLYENQIKEANEEGIKPHKTITNIQKELKKVEQLEALLVREAKMNNVWVNQLTVVPNKDEKPWRTIVFKHNKGKPFKKQSIRLTEINWKSQLYDLVEYEFTKGNKTLRLTVDNNDFNTERRDEIESELRLVCQDFPDTQVFLCKSDFEQPSQEQKLQIIKQCHNDKTSGHMGINKTFDKVQKISRWPGMYADIEEFVKKCKDCQKYKKTRIPQQAQAQVMDTAERPNQKVALDIVGPLVETRKGNKYILSIQDTLTKYVQFFPLKTKKSSEIIENLINGYILKYGFPEIILTDQGQEFNSKLMKDFEESFDIQGITTTSYHPQANGAIERMHSVLGDLIRTTVKSVPTIWDTKLNHIAFAYNTTRQDSIGTTPHSIVFGQNANCPNNLGSVKTDFVKDRLQAWLRRRHEDIAKAKEKLEAVRRRNKEIADKRITRALPIYRVGDNVLLKNLIKKHKLDSEFLGPYKIIAINLEKNRVLIEMYPTKRNKQLRWVNINNTKPYHSYDIDNVRPEIKLTIKRGEDGKLTSHLAK